MVYVWLERARAQSVLTEVQAERRKRRVLPWPVWAKLHRMSMVLSAAEWSVTS